MINVGGVDLSARRKWVPLLDAAACLRFVIDRLDVGATQMSFDFTESNERINFRSEANDVCVSATYADREGRATLVELRMAVLDFVERVLDAAFTAYPDLQGNTSLPRWYPSLRFRGARWMPTNDLR